MKKLIATLFTLVIFLQLHTDKQLVLINADDISGITSGTTINKDSDKTYIITRAGSILQVDETVQQVLKQIESK